MPRRALVFAGVVLTFSIGVLACRETEKVEPGKDAGPSRPSATPSASAVVPDAALSTLVDAAPATPARPPAAGCSKPPGANAFRGIVKRPEGDRAYEARLPAHNPQKPARVVFAIHPFGSSAQEFLRATQMAEVFNPAGWAVVAPEGTNRSFNGGDCCGEAARKKLDDVGFYLAVVDDLAQRGCIDDNRVYLTGFSNGGFMSQAFACEHPERVGAIASVGAVLGWRPCQPKEPVSVLLVNGVGDNVIPPDGGGPFNNRPLSETIDLWRDAGACGPQFGDAGVERSAVGAMCRTEPCREGRTLGVCTVPYAHVWMVKSHPAGNPASARQTAREMLEFFDTYGVR